VARRDADSSFQEGQVTGSIDAAARPRSGSVVAWIVSMLVALCALFPYAVIGLGMRLLMARVFFLSGQAMIDGPVIPLWTFGGVPNFSVVLPVYIKDATLQLFETQYAALPIPTTTAAYIFGYAEFVLPICLALGFATRFAALGLAILTILMVIYVTPDMFWTTHASWILILLALVRFGPGAISVDGLVYYINRP
jgi:putative oxidoreductase